MSLSKFSVVSAFLNMLNGKKRKLGNSGNQQKKFLNQKTPIVNRYHYKKTTIKQLP